MRWLALYFPDLPLAVFDRGLSEERPLAISDRQGGKEQIVRCNATAIAQGIKSGMALNTALSLDANLLLKARDQDRERQALQGLARWAYQYSSSISFDPSMLLLEIEGSLRLFGGLEAMMERLQAELTALGYHYYWAIAPTPAGAGLLARTRPATCATEPAQLQDVVSSIPLRRVTRDSQALTLVHQVGLYSVGDCLALPRQELARRIGPGLALLLDKILGRAADPRTAWQPPEYFNERLLLPAEITQISALTFPANRLILSLAAFLRGRDGVTQQLCWTLIHRDTEPTRFEQGLLAPSQNAAHILGLFRERIERLQLAEPVTEIILQVKHWQMRKEISGDLLGDDKPVSDGFLERLQMRMGKQAVNGLQAQADHRPEQAWRYCRPGEIGVDKLSTLQHTGARQPLWLLEKPHCLVLHQGKPNYGGKLSLQPYPQRIETGWWDGHDVCRDYYLANNPAGEKLWVYQDRRAGQWYLHGFFE